MTHITDHPSVAMLDQLGGNAFLLATGAKDLMSMDNPQPRLQMRLPACKTNQRGTHVEISLTPKDEYTLVFFKMRRGDRRHERDFVGVHRRVQPSDLREAFSDITGLATQV